MAEYLIQGETLDAIAHAINAKRGSSSAMTPAEMAAAIDAIPTGGYNPVEKTVYTHAQDWSTEAGGGNTRNFYNTYFRKGDGLYYAAIKNNTASGDYKAIAATASIGMTKTNSFAFQRTIDDANFAETQRTFLLSSGATVIVWFIPKGVFV